MIARMNRMVAGVRDHGMALARRWTRRKIPLLPSVADRRTILVGASVGETWELERVFPPISSLCVYQFDKTALIEQAIASRPDAIVIKECAAYFPADGVRRELLEGWVHRIREAGIRPVLATVVPVTEAHDRDHPGRFEALVAFNDWLRELGRREAVPLLDLEAALRRSAADRHLADGLDSGDGLHLSAWTYQNHLDPLIPPLYLRVFTVG